MKIEDKIMRQKCMKEKKKLKDRDIYTSPVFISYLQQQTRGLLLGTKRKLNTSFYWDEKKDANIASTDNNTIYINGANQLSTSFPTMELKTASYDGLNGHEAGHALFSDFNELRKLMDSMNAGIFYPDAPRAENETDKDSIDDILYYYGLKDPVVINILATVGAFLNNAIEDVWMEYKMIEKFPGSIRKGINLNAGRMMEQSDSLHEMMQNKDYSSFDICNSLVLQYVRSGNINNWQKLENEYIDFIHTATDTLDDAVFEDITDKRYQSVNQCLVKMWPVIKEEVEKIRKLPPRQQQSGDGSQQKNEQQCGDGSSQKNKPQSQGNRQAQQTSGQGTSDPSQAGGTNSNEQQQSGDSSQQKNEQQCQENGRGQQTSEDVSSKSGNKGNSPAGKAVPLTESEKKKLTEFKRKIEESKSGKMFSKLPAGTQGKPALPKGEIEINGTKQNRKEFRDTFQSLLNDMSEPERFTTEGREAIFMDAFSEEKEKVTAIGENINMN